MSPDKSELRRAAWAARAGVEDEYRVAGALAVAVRALDLPAVRDARTVLAYAATGDELDPVILVHALRERGARIAYPRVCGLAELALHWCGDEAELAPGYCGIAEPAAESDEASIAEIDLVLVPGAAFDEGCRRLGMGGGFYDRLLPGLGESATTVGIAFDEQLIAAVPVEAHDVRLDAVVTPTRTLLPGNA